MRPKHFALAAVFTLAALLAGPAASTALSPSEPPTPAPPRGIVLADADVTQIEFFDSVAFDTDLSQAMRAESSPIKVIVLVPFSLNEIPERMEQWLSRIKTSGGTVKAKAIPEAALTRGIIGALLDVIVAVFDYIAKEAMYGPAEALK